MDRIWNWTKKVKFKSLIVFNRFRTNFVEDRKNSGKKTMNIIARQDSSVLSSSSLHKMHIKRTQQWLTIALLLFYILSYSFYYFYDQLISLSQWHPNVREIKCALTQANNSNVEPRTFHYLLGSSSGCKSKTKCYLVLNYKSRLALHQGHLA